MVDSLSHTYKCQDKTRLLQQKVQSFQVGERSKKGILDHLVALKTLLYKHFNNPFKLCVKQKLHHLKMNTQNFK